VRCVSGAACTPEVHKYLKLTKQCLFSAMRRAEKEQAFTKTMICIASYSLLKSLMSHFYFFYGNKKLKSRNFLVSLF